MSAPFSLESGGSHSSKAEPGEPAAHQARHTRRSSARGGDCCLALLKTVGDIGNT